MWDSRVMKHGLRLGFNGQFDDFDDFDDKGRPVLITAAAPSYEVEHRTRVRKYLTLMAFRVPALILAAIAYGAWHNGLISLLIVAASVPLPWMAVLIANDRPPRRADEPRRFDVARRRIPLFPTAERPALEPRRQPAERSAPRDSPTTVSRLLAGVPGCRPLATLLRTFRSSADSCTSQGVRSLLGGNSKSGFVVKPHDSASRSGGRYGRCTHKGHHKPG